MLNCRLKVISPYNHGSSKCKRQIRTISEIIMKHLWDKGQMWPLFATTAAYAMNTFASEALSGFSPFQLVFLRDPLDLTSLSFPKLDTIPVKHGEYYNLLLARAQLIGRLLLEWRTKQMLDNQMVYLLAPHASVLQTNTTKFKQDFIGPLFIDTALDKMHYRLKDATGLPLDSINSLLKHRTINYRKEHYKMVPKNLIIFTVLLWTMRQCMARRSIKAKYRETGKINYR